VADSIGHLFGKPLAALTLVIAFRYPVKTGFVIAASLAQIGEFSFILGALGVSLGLLPKDGQSLILAGALFSIALNPIVFRALARPSIATRRAWALLITPRCTRVGAIAPFTRSAREGPVRK
jgi:CPA2 family monovalent cation:H+ antiporter-2